MTTGSPYSVRLWKSFFYYAKMKDKVKTDNNQRRGTKNSVPKEKEKGFMIDFENGSVFKLRKTGKFGNEKTVSPLLIPGEVFIGEYQAVRDYVIFTNKRVIAVNVQGVTGKKKDFTTLPYSKVQLFSVETSGVFDLDSELELYFSGVGLVQFQFTGASDILEIARVIGEHVL